MEYELKKEFENIDLEDFYLLDALKSSLDKFEDIKKIQLLNFCSK